MLTQQLKENFGFAGFMPGQPEVIEHILAGDSAAAIFPTGSGKSLCYQFPALFLPHLTVVVSPLLALIQDQLEFLKAKSIPAARIDSSLSRAEEYKIMSDLKAGQYKILMIAVERFKNERFRRFLAGLPISLLVIDEAHCISEWGHNFRPDYLKLPVYQRDFNIPQVLLLTATATPQVIDDMCDKFKLPHENVTVTGFYRPNLHLQVQPVKEQDKPEKLHSLLKDNPEAPTIVYVTLQKTAENVAEALNVQGLNPVAYHAGMKYEDREQIQNDFMAGRINCIVATIAFGMGVDKRDIRRVIHYDLPKSLESYSQEIGRAGRDGEISECVVLANLDNVNILENFAYGDTPELAGIQTVLEQIPRDSHTWDLQLYDLSKLSNIRVLTLKTLLVYLEMKGIIKPRYSYFAQYQYSNIISDGDIINSFTGERRDFAQAVFSASSKSRKWTTVHFDKVMEQYNTDRNRIIAALEYFEEQGMIELSSKQMTEVFEITNPDFDPNELSNELYNLFIHKERVEIERISRMLDYFSNGECLSHALASYFGERLDWQKCGNCSVCATGTVTITRSIDLPPLENYDFNELTTELQERNDTPASADLITKFLCGITVPALSLVKAKQLYGFARLERYRYHDIKQWVSNHLS